MAGFLWFCVFRHLENVPQEVKIIILAGALWQLPAWWLVVVPWNAWAEEQKGWGRNRGTGIAFAGRTFASEGGAYSEDTVRNILKSQVHFCALQFKGTWWTKFVWLFTKRLLVCWPLRWSSCGSQQQMRDELWPFLPGMKTFKATVSLALDRESAETQEGFFGKNKWTEIPCVSTGGHTGVCKCHMCLWVPPHLPGLCWGCSARVHSALPSEVNGRHILCPCCFSLTLQNLPCYLRNVI